MWLEFQYIMDKAWNKARIFMHHSAICITIETENTLHGKMLMKH